MNVHKNARLAPKGREILISRLERGEHPMDVATSMGVSASTVYKWRRRYRAEGFAGLLDRSSRPNASPKRTRPSVGQLGPLDALRRLPDDPHRAARRAWPAKTCPNEPLWPIK